MEMVFRDFLMVGIMVLLCELLKGNIFFEKYEKWKFFKECWNNNWEW